jgi:hypothetical protein
MKNVDIAEQERKEFLNRQKQEERSDLFVKGLLIAGVVYFGLHIASAMAQVVFMPDGRIVNCAPLPNGTIVCL